ncbi:uncharacterized protein LOC133528332 isoform X1 [Cydia pomonella]|uniref:uncharacterized protein LOC133528332 isoform X1 n=1 Tax=Cydia pomonella TaxID=82600 RepID=UPI002ADE18FD|nr:uncharacterized protein LOC133528332 isoform X1 [Cydia pomonella]
MSIPPLVCSTPPPPDQCEDDKDPEEFDLQYNLSQEDDYDYGSFSTYNHFQSAISVNKPLSEPIHKNNANNGDSSETLKNACHNETLNWTNTNIENKLNDDQKQEIEVKLHNDTEIDSMNSENQDSDLKTEDNCYEDTQTNKKINNEEELNIEDLNLTVEEESLNSVVKNELYDSNVDIDKSTSSDKNKSPHIPDVTSIITSDLHETLPLDEITSTPPSLDDIDDPRNSIDDLKMDNENVTDSIDVKNETETGPTLNMNDQVETVQVPETFQEVLAEVNNETDDEFGDFNDFHSASNIRPSTITSIVDACENPWENNQTDSMDHSQMPQSSDFGAFEAHFEDAEETEPPIFDEFKSEAARSAPDGQSLEQNIVEDDDDFGDFDDFKSSVQETKDHENDIQDPLARVLDFQSTESESQLLENINKILNSIFEEEIPEPETEFDGKLEGMLCETWGHLLETDVRQPYIINWNSSIGQKTLLKALCIDSRNILFGPKWSYNMPKYAANLSAAPLQPQKQATLSGQTTSEVTEKHVKPPGTWSDPFTSDGQEFTYAEALLLDLEHLMATLDQMAHNHSTLKISELLSHACNKETNVAAPKRPTDLDVFDTDLTTKSDKIYSSTLDVQPIRQINLPDTHIFTPTDSETPRSKTIHYSGPSFLSQSPMETDKNPTEEKSEDPADAKVLDDADYSDFQDFKGSFQVDALEVKPAAGLSMDGDEPPSNPNQLQPSPYSIGLLQPIKIEPIIPTLNWPSPGEVKETFDDFTEFASTTTWNNDVQETKTPSIYSENTPQIDNTSVVNDNSIKSIEPPSKINDSFEDDFDTFQSALPPNVPTLASPVRNFSNFASADFSQNKTQVVSSQEPEFDFVFQKIETKSDPISFNKSNDILNYSEPFMHQNNVAISVPKVKETVAKTPAPSLAPPLSAVLQPTMSSSQTPQNSAQILQPLSLESFSQINWPNPGINLQDLSRFNPVETLNSLKTDLSVSGNSKGASPVHSQKAPVQNQPPEDDIWGEFVSSKPKSHQSLPKKTTTFVDDDEWTDFVSSPSVKPQNGLNTISLNVHTNLSIQKSTKPTKQNNQALEIPMTHYITPKSSNHSSYNDRHFQNL